MDLPGAKLFRCSGNDFMLVYDGEQYEKNQIDVPSTYPGTDAITDGVTEVELTSEIIAQLLASRQDCGAENAQDVAVIIQGSNCTMKKVTIE